MNTAVTKVHQALAQSIIDHGIDTVFGLMGDANLFLSNHFVQELKGRFVPVVYEGSSVLAAMGYWHVSGKVGVATVTHGPGLSNCLTALIEGARRHSPCVLIAGDTPAVDRNAVQGTDQRELVKATGAGFEQVRAPETALNDLAAAFHRAEAEKRPIVLNVPSDYMWQDITYRKTVYPSFKTKISALSGEAFDDAMGMIAFAKRPLILAGVGAKEAKSALEKLSERLDAPLATTLKGKDMFLDHPNNMDILGTLSTPHGYEAIAKADCIIAFGTSLHHFTTDRGKLFKGKRVIQISDDLLTLGRFHVPDAGIVGDPAAVAEQIIALMDEAEIASSGFRQELPIASLSKHPHVEEKPETPGVVDLSLALQRLDERLPADRILVTDGGRFMTEVWCRVSATDPQHFISGTDFGAIGLGMQTALGMGIAGEGRPVCLFTGDGGFMMGGLNEFNTAIRAGIDLIVIVCNDAAYGAEHIQLKRKNLDPATTEFNWPSFAQTATALGGEGVLATSLAQLDLALDKLEARKGPFLIELSLDPNSVPPMRI